MNREIGDVMNNPWGPALIIIAWAVGMMMGMIVIGVM